MYKILTIFTRTRLRRGQGCARDLGSACGHFVLFYFKDKLLKWRLLISYQYPSFFVYDLHHTKFLQTTELVSFLFRPQ
eukprot:UN12724